MAMTQNMARNLSLHNMLLRSLGFQITVTFPTPTPNYANYRKEAAKIGIGEWEVCRCKSENRRKSA